MRERGEESPLDVYPVLDAFEESIYRQYNSAHQLKSTEHFISGEDYLAFFILTGVNETRSMLLRLLMAIDREATLYRSQVAKKKQEYEAQRRASKK